MNTNKYISDTVRNNIVSLAQQGKCTLPQKKALQSVVEGLFRKGTPILRELAEEKKKGSVKKQSEKIGKHLGNMDITSPVEQLCLRKAAQEIQEETVIAYDLSDISKKSAKKMEGIRRVFDGSERKTANGYFLHGVGTEHFLLRLDLHDGDKEFLPQRRKKILEEIQGKIGKKGIWAFDRGNDSKSLFEFLQKKEMKFIVRLQKRRMLIDCNTGEVRSVHDHPEGRYEVYIRDEKGKVNTEHRYILIIKNHLTESHSPIRLLCSLSLKEKTSTELVDLYLKRWGVENSFKRIKSLYQLERIRVMKWKRLKTLISLILFVAFLTSWIYRKIQKEMEAISSHILILYKTFLKKVSRTFNQHSFAIFFRKIFPKNLSFFIGAKPPYPQRQTSLWGFCEGKLGVI